MIKKTRCRCGQFDNVTEHDISKDILQVPVCIICYEQLLLSKNILVEENNKLHARIKELEKKE